jgi:hypothetical protein
MLSFLLVVSSAFAQTLNPALTTECSTAAQSAVSSLSSSCGANVVSLIAMSAPVGGIIAAGSSESSLTSFCSSACSTSVTAFTSAIATTCAGQIVFNGTDAKAETLKQNYDVDTQMVCITDSGSICLSREIYPAFVASGFSATNPSTLTPAFITFATDAKKSCTTCANKLLAAIKTNAAAFAQYSSILNAAVSQVETTCKAAALVNSNGAESFGAMSVFAVVAAACAFSTGL